MVRSMANLLFDIALLSSFCKLFTFTLAASCLMHANLCSASATVRSLSASFTRCVAWFNISCHAGSTHIKIQIAVLSLHLFNTIGNYWNTKISRICLMIRLRHITNPSPKVEFVTDNFFYKCYVSFLFFFRLLQRSVKLQSVSSKNHCFIVRL